MSKDTKGAWLPAERIYSIIFEFEQIESRTGQFPSTEGFLKLLTSLFIAAGAPSSLGRESRTRPGCTPYIEFVADFVLPRALGGKQNKAPLQFRSPADKGRLVSRGLEVIEAVLARYTVPTSVATSPVPPLVDEKNSQRLATNDASQMFGLSSLVEKIALPPNENDAKEISLDYRNAEVTRAATRSDDFNAFDQTGPNMETTQVEQAFAGNEPLVPRAKSPGFTVLAELLSASVGPLLNAIVTVLTDEQGARGIRSICGLEGYKDHVALALFGQTPPTLLSASAKSTGTSHISAQALVQPLLPQLEELGVDRSDAICWREMSIILALRVLCAAAAREEAFGKAVTKGQVLLKLVPVLRFHRRTLPPSGIIVRNVQITRLADLLLSLGRDTRLGGGSYTECFPAVIKYISCDASSKQHDAQISSPAVAMTYYASQTLGTNESIRALVGCRSDGLSRFASAMGSRLSRSAKYAALREDKEVASLILDSILSAFRGGCARETSIAHVMLGLPFTMNGNMISGTYEHAYQLAGRGGITRDCFDAILDRIADMEFLTESSSSSLAARCFEIVFRLTEKSGNGPAETRRVNYSANILRYTHFWTANLMRLLADHSSGSASFLSQVASIPTANRPKGIECCVQCVAWLLKSVASELLALDESHPGSSSGQRRQLLSLLFSSPYRLFMNVLECMPICNDQNAYLGHEGRPSREVLEASREQMRGAPEVVGEYQLINKTKLSQQSVSPSALEEQLNWADGWNAWASWDCAISHLSASLPFLVEAAAASLHSSRAASAMSTGSSVGSFELKLPVDMMKVILTRLVDEGSESGEQQRQMDARLSPNVSLNLSRVVLLLAEQMASTDGASEIPSISMESAVVEICRLLVYAIISSSSEDQGRPLNPSAKLRTATFGLALSVMVKSDPGVNFLDGVTEAFVQASIELGRLACMSLSGSTGDSESQRGRSIAQFAFSSILDLCREEENLSIVPVLTAQSDPGMARTIAQAIVSLLAALDDQIFHVIVNIVSCREGPELLLEARLPQALLEAARDYISQEQRLKEDIRYSSVSFNIPSFFKGHMSLIKSLLLSPMLPIDRRRQVSVDIAGVLLMYTDVVHRLFDSFPREADVLVNCLQCLLLASEGGGLQQFVSDEKAYVWTQDILQLTYVLSQNPFPRRYLSTLPMKIQNAGRNVSVSSNVSVSDAYKTDSSWWDETEQLPQHGVEADRFILTGPPSGRAQDFGWRSDPSLGESNSDPWTASKYESALIGAVALDSCLSYLESLSSANIQLLSLDGCALVRGLCRCSDAAKV